MTAIYHLSATGNSLVERSLIIITNLFAFFLYPALKLITVAMAMLKNFALLKEKIHNKFYAILIRERSTRYIKLAFFPLIISRNEVEWMLRGNAKPGSIIFFLKAVDGEITKKLLLL